jgi:hypothetical protein
VACVSEVSLGQRWQDRSTHVVAVIVGKKADHREWQLRPEGGRWTEWVGEDDLVARYRPVDD